MGLILITTVVELGNVTFLDCVCQNSLTSIATNCAGWRIPGAVVFKKVIIPSSGQ